MTKTNNDITLLVEYLDVCNTALAARKESFPHKQVLALSRFLFSGRNFTLLLYDDDPDLPDASFTLRFTGGQLELVSEGKQDPVFSCKVKRDYLRGVIANRREYIQHPEKLDWDWLKSRLGFGHTEAGEMAPVREWMSEDVISVPPDASVRQAAMRMREANAGALAVLDAGRPVGILTDRDIAVRVVAGGMNPDSTAVGDVMSRDVVCCAADLPAKDAAAIMQERAIRRLLVLDAGNRLAGLLSLDDLASQPPAQPLAGETLARITATYGTRAGERAAGA